MIYAQVRIPFDEKEERILTFSTTKKMSLLQAVSTCLNWHFSIDSQCDSENRTVFILISPMLLEFFIFFYFFIVCTAVAIGNPCLTPFEIRAIVETHR